MDGLSHFCVMCFADESDGSWNHVTIPESNYCTNCSSGGTLIQIPRSAVEAIRRNASWVGKRYYPADEDSIAFREREELLKLVQTFPGRSAKEVKDDSSRWEVSQCSPDGRTTSTWVSAENGDDALRRAKSLTYYSDEQLGRSVSLTASPPVQTEEFMTEHTKDLVEALHEGRRAIGDHFAPNDCYATGPVTGDEYRDLVQCPACSFIAMYDTVIAKATAHQQANRRGDGVR